MRFGCSLEMVNILTSGPCVFTRQSKKFWMDYLKYIAAVGFQGIELPFNCFSSDAMAFETGRSGIPCNAVAISSKYGSPEEFLGMLQEIGIEKVVDIHVNANDAMLELAATAGRPQEYYRLVEQLCMEGLEHAASLHAESLVISPTPEIGWIREYFPDEENVYLEKTLECMRRIVEKGKEKGVDVALKNEFWSLCKGDRISEFLEQTDAGFAPDLAHLKIAEDSEEQMVEMYYDKITCLKMSDTNFVDRAGNAERINAEIPVKGTQKVFCDCGEGNVKIESVLQILKRRGYTGWVICENKKTLDVYRGLLKLGWFVNRKLADELE